MPFDDEDPEGSLPGGSPLPPEDRLWRHPSEVGAAEMASQGPAPRWIPALAALGGAVAAVAVIAAAGAFVDRAPVAPGGTERVALPAVATVPVLQDRSTKPATVDPAHLVTVEGPDDRTGTGILLRSDGYVATAASLVADARQVQVTTHDGTRGSAAVRGHDAVTGVAVLDVDWMGQTTSAVLSAHGTLSIGDRVSSAGAGDIELVHGLVSDLSASTTTSATMVHGLIRTTTALADGAVGGPILDREGGVVAMALWSDPSPATWSMPIDVVRQVADDLITEGRALHPWLGVEGDDGPDGPELVAVAAGSPADDAGLVAGDVLTEIDGRPLQGMADVVLALRGHRPGDEIAIAFRRTDTLRHCVAELAERVAD